MTWTTEASVPVVLFCLVTASGWELMSRCLASPLVPRSSEIAYELVRITAGGFAFHELAATLWRVVLGFSAALLAALLLGIPAARSAFIRRFVGPGILLGLTVPGLVWALLCVIWFGVGTATAVTAITLGVAPALTVQIIQGIESVDRDILEMVRVFEVSPLKKISVVWVPALFPYLATGTRLGLSLAWKVIVLVEMFGLSSGVGYQLQSEFSSQNVAGVLAWTILFWFVMALIDFVLIRPVETWSIRWRR